jgi:hypothetical protein
MIGTGFMDLYVDSKKYASRKTESGKNNYITRCVNENIESIINTNIGGTFDDPALELRNADLKYLEGHVVINDLGYHNSNKVRPCSDLKKTPVRVFGIDRIVGMVLDETVSLHIEVKRPSFIFKICGYKVV